jgi:hypothetical protein
MTQQPDARLYFCKRLVCAHEGAGKGGDAEARGLLDNKNANTLMLLGQLPSAATNGRGYRYYGDTGD